MGALAPVYPWIPEDDLLLKNAVEAGASLESLAKGAVQFSRKFSVREIQERWHSLLYDPIISAEAAFHMIEFERSASTPQSKFSNSGNSKESKFISGKRKAENVRSCYYALRKRICNEPFTTMDLSFLIAPADISYMGNEDEPFSGNCILGDTTATHFGLEESNLDIMHHPFPQIGDDATANAFHAQLEDTVQEDFSMEQGNVCREILHNRGEDMSYPRNESMIQEFSRTKEYAENDGQVHGCSKFDGDHVLNSPIPECTMSFHNLEYPSPLPEMPIWRTVEAVSPPSIPANMHTGDTFSLGGDGDTKNTCLSEYGFHGDPNLKLEIPIEEMKNDNVTAGTEGYLAELTNSLLDFTNDELLFTDVDGKDAIDKSYYDGLSSLLLSSPNDANQDIVNMTEPETSLNPDYLTNKPVASCRELDKDPGSNQGGDGVGDSEEQCLTSVSTSNPRVPELIVEVIICTLNTEDTEIPCNDDVVFPNHARPKSFASIGRRNFHDACKPNSSTAREQSNNPKIPTSISKELSNAPKTGEGGVRNLENTTHASSQMMRPQVTPEAGSLHHVGDVGMKFNLPTSGSSHKNIVANYGGLSQINSADTITGVLASAKLKEETPEVFPVKHFTRSAIDSSIEKPVVAPNGYKCCPQMNVNDAQQDHDAPARMQNCQTSHADVGSIDVNPHEEVVKHTLSDPEEPPIESDDDVPYFSDIEAMILDMDLDPEDQDLYSSEEVSRYQREDMKKVIIRLEQGAHSCIQRSIASQGALAVLYGHFCKHFIKKPEVLLGRSTEAVIVDIDLSREGRANKISRRQATITLDKSGFFHLKNLGKFPISVNDKAVAFGQSQSLSSSCLIEIRGIPLIFEKNQTWVNRYLNNQSQEEHLN